MALGALIAILDHGPVAQDEFDDWYDTEHIPERLAVPGFLNAQRWVVADGSPVSVVLYDLTDLSVLDGEAYRSIGGENLSPWSNRVIGRCDRFLRYAAEQLTPGDAAAVDEAGGLLVFAMDVDPEADEEFNRWYDTEHLPALSEVPGVLLARHFRVHHGDHAYIATYHVTDPAVRGSEGWREAAETPWTHRIRERTRNRLVLACRPYQRR